MDLEAPAGPVALVFPGQGAHRPAMLEPFAAAPGREDHLARVGALLGRDPTTAPVDDNVTSSLLTVLASVLALEVLRAAAPELEVVAVAGYSVGQWTALHAAGAIGGAALFELVAARARLMDEAIAAAGPTGMLAVIGVRAPDVESVCAETRAEGRVVEITNRNAPGQVTLGGTVDGLAAAEERLRAFRPKGLVRVPVAGAWHGRFVAGAVEPLAVVIEALDLRPTDVPVVDNTTGRWLPADLAGRRRALARQVAAPVLWEEGVRTMIAAGADPLIEVGYGDVLTRFGFFIDRSVGHRAMVRTPR